MYRKYKFWKWTSICFLWFQASLFTFLIFITLWGPWLLRFKKIPIIIVIIRQRSKYFWTTKIVWNLPSRVRAHPLDFGWFIPMLWITSPKYLRLSSLRSGWHIWKQFCLDNRNVWPFLTPLSTPFTQIKIIQET